MKCPVCNINLIMTERQGVEIDYCPQCRGVWLDRGELDKIIDRSSIEQQPPTQRRDNDDDNRRFESDRRYSGDRDDDHRHKSRRKSFLGDLFDFD